MRKISILLAAVFMMAGLSACNDFSSPEGVVGTAYKAVKKNDLKLLRKTLDPSIRDQLGTKEGMASLKANLERADVTILDNQIVGGSSLGDDDQIVNYRLVTAALTIGVTCSVTWQDLPCNVDPRMGGPNPVYNGNIIPSRMCYSDANQKVEVRDCRITSVDAE
jgi:hypothetical protein